MNPRVAAIFAISENHVIGSDNDIPWRLSNDLKHFKKLTTGKPIIMGRKTWESLGRPLPRRRNIVITRNTSFEAHGAEVVHSLQEALDLCADEPEVFIVGGAAIYREAILNGHVSVIYKTLVHAEVDGDTFLHLPEDGWEVTQVESHQADEKNEYAYTFLTLERGLSESLNV